MKNLKVSAKLAIIMGMFLVMFVILITGVTVSINRISSQLETLYNHPYQVKSEARELEANVEGLIKSVLRRTLSSDPLVEKDADEDITKYLENVAICLSVINDRYLGDTSIIEKLEAELQDLAADRDHALEMTKSGMSSAEVSQFIEANNMEHIRTIESYIDEITVFADNKGETLIAEVREQQQNTIVMMISLAGISLVLSIALGIAISRSMTAPLGRIRDLMNRTSSTGNLQLSVAEEKAVDRDMQSRDEIGQTILAYKRLIEHITKMSSALKRVAEKDLSEKVVVLSELDALGNSIRGMQENLNRMFAEMQMAITQVSVGSAQIADGAQALAQGVTEQSAVIEQLGVSMLEISKQTDNNVVLAQHTKANGNEIKEEASRGAQQMRELLRAMDEIGNANKSISKIISLIEDISFQTNILSLNAAIEAARAGEHGRGFAVIVSAVRELAAKSAEAADTINHLVATSTEKTERGATLSETTAKTIEAILSRTLNNVEAVEQIAQASIEQASAISQVVTGIDQVSEVVNRNSTTAEQSAAASEEMSRQASQLREYLSQFKISSEN